MRRGLALAGGLRPPLAGVEKATGDKAAPPIQVASAPRDERATPILIFRALEPGDPLGVAAGRAPPSADAALGPADFCFDCIPRPRPGRCRACNRTVVARRAVAGRTKKLRRVANSAASVTLGR